MSPIILVQNTPEFLWAFMYMSPSHMIVSREPVENMFTVLLLFRSIQLPGVPYNLMWKDNPLSSPP